MQNVIKKATGVAMVAAAALAVSACGKTEAKTTSENVSMTDMNAEGSMNDMSATDMNSTNSMGGANDMSMSNGAMDNSSMMGGNSTSNMQ